MAQPTKYQRQYDFSDYQDSFPNVPLPGNALDNELDNAKFTLDQLLVNLALLQKDDGTVRNSTIGVDQIKPDLAALLSGADGEVRGIWAQGVDYKIGDLVQAPNGGTYIATVDHTSSNDFEVDKSGMNYWFLFANPITYLGVPLYDTIDGTGVEVSFGLSQNIGNKYELLVFLDGAFQNYENFEVDGNVLTFLAPPPIGVNNILVLGLDNNVVTALDAAIEAQTISEAAQAATTLDAISTAAGAAQVAQDTATTLAAKDIAVASATEAQEAAQLIIGEAGYEDFNAGNNDFTPGVDLTITYTKEATPTNIFIDGIIKRPIVDYNINLGTKVVTFTAPISAHAENIFMTFADRVGTPSIGNKTITNPKLADMSEARIKGRATGNGIGIPEDLTGAQVAQMIGFSNSAYATAAQGVKADSAIQVIPAPQKLTIAHIVPEGNGGGYAYAGSWRGRAFTRKLRNNIPNAEAYIVLQYDNKTVNFTAGETVTGATTGSTGIIQTVTDNGVTGILLLKDMTGMFVNNEVLNGSITGVAVSNLSENTAGRIFLPAGDYEVSGYCNFFYTSQTEVRLYDEVNAQNITHQGDPLVASAGHNNRNAGYNQGHCIFSDAPFTLAQDTMISPQYYCSSTYSLGQGYVSGGQQVEKEILLN